MAATECPGGDTDTIYYGLAKGLCPICNEFVPLISDGHTVRHFGRDPDEDARRWAIAERMRTEVPCCDYREHGCPCTCTDHPKSKTHPLGYDGSPGADSKSSITAHTDGAVVTDWNTPNTTADEALHLDGQGATDG